MLSEQPDIPPGHIPPAKFSPGHFPLTKLKAQDTFPAPVYYFCVVLTDDCMSRLLDCRRTVTVDL